MSRIGKLPVTVPKGVNVDMKGRELRVKGPKGELGWEVVTGVDVAVEGNVIKVSRPDDSRDARSKQGLARTLINNMMLGVTQGYTRKLIINGVEYRVELKGRFLNLGLGYSHPIAYELPDGVNAAVEKGAITLTGADKQLVGAVAAELRALRPVEPYKGKGIQYEGEKVRRKEGKAGAA